MKPIRGDTLTVVGLIDGCTVQKRNKIYL